MVIWRTGDASSRPEVTFPLIELVVSSTGVEEQHSWGAINQPPSVHRLNAPLVHVLDRSDQCWIPRLDLFNLDGGGRAVQRPKQCVARAILCGCDLCFRFKHTVDTADAIGDLSGHFEKHMVVHVSAGLVAHVADVV